MSWPTLPQNVALPPKVRAIMYYVLALIGIALAAAQAAYLVVGEQPKWLLVLFAVYGVLGTASGLTAASNTQTKQDPPATELVTEYPEGGPDEELPPQG